MSSPEPASPDRAADWEAFYRDYRKPGYVPGFEITSKLGGGMFGLVFRARKQSIGKDYAIKFLQVDDTEVRRAVLAELEQVKHFAQIDHPNLVSIEDRGEVDGIPYLVMSFAGTQTLRDRMATNGQPPAPADRAELLSYFLQACRGLCALHERSLVHFDIKPANVFLKGPVARLGDYGLSKLITHSRGSLSMGRGTPYYMAPEMLQRRGDHRSDVYSLGVMLYEVLCGVVPFTGDSEWEVLRKHENEKPSLPAHLSSLERAVLQRCLQKDPAARFQSVHDLIAAFGSSSSPGAAAWSEVRGGTAATPPPLPRAPAAPGSTPPPLPDVPPPPVSEDHLAALGRASRDIARHATHVARDAMRGAERIARETFDDVRGAVSERTRGQRRWRAWRRLDEEADAGARAHAKDVAAAVRDRGRRRGPSVLAVVGALGLMVFAVVVVAVMFMPVQMQPEARLVASAPVPDERLLHSVVIPRNLAGLFSTSTPHWVNVAEYDRAAARNALKEQLGRMCEALPLRAEQRSLDKELPHFGVTSGMYPEQESDMRGELERLVAAREFDRDRADRLLQYAPAVLANAAEQLGNVRYDSVRGMQRARHLQAFLVQATECDDIELVDDETMSKRDLERANKQLGALWLCYLNEIAPDRRTWRVYCDLEGIR